MRHPAVAVAPGTCYGRSDVRLADAPALTVDTWLARLALCLPAGRGAALTVDSSPLTRCLSVAEALAESLNAVVRSDPRLQEMDFGAWELQRWDDIDRAALDAWAADLRAARPHGGETLDAFAARLASWTRDALHEGAAAPSRGVSLAPRLIVTHAGVIRVLTALLLQRRADACLGWPLSLGGICHLHRTARGAWQVLRWNA